MRLFKTVLLTLLIVGTLNSSKKDDDAAETKSQGCIECDKYEVGETFSIDGKMIPANQN